MSQLTHDQWTAACKTADEAMKARNGHTYMTILKTRCQYCGRSPRQRGRCQAWFMTFLDELYLALSANERETEGKRAS